MVIRLTVLFQITSSKSGYIRNETARFGLTGVKTCENGKFQSHAGTCKIFLDALRKQSFSLILTVIGLGGLAWWNVEYKREMSAIVTALDAQVKVCSEKREALAVESRGAA